MEEVERPDALLGDFALLRHNVGIFSRAAEENAENGGLTPV
jgi:hypothetical protein